MVKTNCSCKDKRCKCSKSAKHFWVDHLPTEGCPNSLYFLKILDNVSEYVTDNEGNYYLLSGDTPISDITITSPNNTILVSRIGNEFKIDVVSGSGEDNEINSITLNGEPLTPDGDKNINIQAVETVTGNLVDNTDPTNPTVNFNSSDYDIEDFTNTSADPYVRQSGIPNIGNHNSLNGLQGGEVLTGEFYHLKEGEYDYLKDIVDNDTITKIKDAIVEPPVYTPPTSTITNVTQVLEVGSNIPIDIVQTFNQNDAGNKVSEEINKNGTTVSTTNSFSETLTVPTTTTVYSGKVAYGEGATKNNNLGEPDPTGKILAGEVVSTNRTITPRYPFFYGVFNTKPTSITIDLDVMIKSMSDSNQDVTTTVNANDQFIAIAIPTTNTVKTNWFVTELNQGSIGGETNLFATTTTAPKNSPDGYWGGVSYRFYITNYKTTVQTIQLRS